MRQLGRSPLMCPAADSLRADTLLVVAARYRAPAAEQRRFRQWLQTRLAPRPSHWVNE